MQVLKKKKKTKINPHKSYMRFLLQALDSLHNSMLIYKLVYTDGFLIFNHGIFNHDNSIKIILKAATSNRKSVIQEFSNFSKGSKK